MQTPEVLLLAVQAGWRIFSSPEETLELRLNYLSSDQCLTACSTFHLHNDYEDEYNDYHIICRIKNTKCHGV